MLRSVTTRTSGLIILIAGIWGGLIPFVGPYFHFVLGPDKTWMWSADRFYLSVLPGLAAVVGGLLLLGAGPWAVGRLGALIALAGGVWFAVGPDVSRFWHGGGAQGFAHGHGGKRALEFLTFHSGIGVLITALAAFSLPGFFAARRARVERDAAVGGTAAAPGTATTARRVDGEPAARTETEAEAEATRTRDQ